jgi:hypothetical protein
MKKTLALLMLAAAPMIAGPYDTLYVLRVVPDDSTGAARQVRAVFNSGCSVEAGAFGKVNITIPERIVWNDSTAAYDTVGSILKGVDTAHVKIIITTGDTLPAGGLEGLRLDDAGLFLHDD